MYLVYLPVPERQTNLRLDSHPFCYKFFNTKSHAKVVMGILLFLGLQPSASHAGHASVSVYSVDFDNRGQM
jgi:hypothetical protein